MDATSLYTTLAIRKAKYPLVIDREQAMINAIEAKLSNLQRIAVPFENCVFRNDIHVTQFAL